MKIELLNFDNNHCATGLTESDNMLKWDASGHTHNLIIRDDYGTRIEFSKADKLGIEKYETEKILSGEEFCYTDTRFFVVLPKSYIDNYSFSVNPATYAVFCCEYDSESDICKIYIPSDDCLYQCDVSASVEVRITKEPLRKKKLFSRAEEKQYYTVNIPNIPGYTDGGLFYSFEGYNYAYPITNAMLGKSIRIPDYDSKPPKIDTTFDNGYKLIIR